MTLTEISFHRAKSRYKPQPTILVICEDTKSGLNYIKDARKHFRVDAKVEVSNCGRTDPMGIVEQALKRKTKFDRVYCMIDRDTHTNFDAAIALASQSSKVSIIDSHPCFEFWLLLHFKKSRRPYTTSGKNSPADNLIKDLRKIPSMEKYNKGDDQGLFDALLGDKLNLALKNAPLVLHDAISEQNLNPSTKIHLLINDFKELREPQMVE